MTAATDLRQKDSGNHTLYNDGKSYVSHYFYCCRPKQELMSFVVAKTSNASTRKCCIIFNFRC